MSEPRIVPPGPTLGITAPPADQLTDDALLDRIIAAERLTAWAQAQQLSAMAALLDRRTADDQVLDAAAAAAAAAGVSGGPARPVRRPTVDGGRSAVDEIAMALRIPRVTAGRRVDLAHTVTARLPACLTALAYGDLDLAKVRTIADGTLRLTDSHTATVEQVIVPLAGDLTTGALKAKVERVAAQLQPQTVEEDHEDAAEGRRVIRWALPDGMAEVRATLTATGAAAVWSMLNTLAETARHPGDGRTCDQLRADVLTDLATDYVTGHLHLVPTTAAPEPAAPECAGDEESVGSPAGPDRETTRTNRTDPVDPVDQTDPVDSGAKDADPVEDAFPGGRGAEEAGPAGRRTEDANPVEDAFPAAAADIEAGTVAGTAPGQRPGQRPGPLPGRTPRWAQVHLLIPADLLAGRPSPPAELSGHGPIPTSLALRLAADADWHRLIYDPDTGRALALSSRAHDPPTALREFIGARDRTCRAPGCRQPRTDLDHRQPHHRGGKTDEHNLGLYCRHHHRLKQHPHWQATRDHHGTEHWTTPT